MSYPKKFIHYTLLILICLTAGITMAAPITLPDEPFQQQVDNITTQPSYAPLAAVPCTDGMADEYPCENVDLMAFMPFTEMGITNTVGLRSADIWGWTDSTTGDEYALLNLTIGTSFIRITDPENPVALGLLPTHTDASNWRDVKVYEDHAFIVSEAGLHGLQVFDLTQLRAITATTSISPTTIFTHTAHYDAFGSAHNIAINEESGFAYAVGAGTTIGTRSVCSGGLHFIDISDPVNPLNSGCFSEDGYTHDVQCVMYDGPDTEHVGKEICLASNEDTVTIVDVTDKSTPIMLSRTGYPNAKYTHQGWLTEDHAYFLVNDELDERDLGVPTETYFWDVSDLDAPFIDNIYSKGITSIDHNLYTRHNAGYLSNYESGLRILSISDPQNPIEIGYFDVHPQSDSVNFAGTWSNYPYFESGNVIISSIGRGLFIVRPKSLAITAPELVTSCDASPVAAEIRLHTVLGTNTPATLTVSDQEIVTLGMETMLPGETQTITFTADGSEDVDVVIEGTDGTSTDNATITLIQSAPDAVTLLSPTPNVVSLSQQTTFSWSPIRTASSYQLQISDTPTFSNIVYESTVAGVSHTATNLPENALLYWRVTAINECGSTVSEVQTTASLPEVMLCTMLYEEDFESGADGWDTGVITSESLNTWALGSVGAYNSTAGWYSIDITSSGQALSSPAITLTVDTTELSRVESLTLRYWEKRNLSPTDDVILLTLREGDQFSSISDSLFSEPYDTPSTFPGINVTGWSGTRDWTEMEVNLAPLAGAVVRFGYIILPGTVIAAPQPAWALDDISVELCQSLPQPADFNSGTLSYGLAWHGGDGIQRLGANWDSESTPASGTAPTSADVNIPGLIINESKQFDIDATQDGWVRGWFDWNGDGVYTADELIIDQAVSAGTTTVAVTPPAGTVEAEVGYRLRLSTDSTVPTWDAVGFVVDGEVEDGRVTVSVLPTAVTLTQTINMISPPILIIIATLLTMVTFTTMKRTS